MSEIGRPMAKKKKCGKKSKTGCTTCRIRRVKCDETKPSCQRCTSTGRTCDGYPIVSRSQTWHVVTLEAQSLIQHPLSDQRFSSQESGESFLFFRTKTVGTLSGLFKSEFWEKIVLRASENNDAIFYSVLAVGAAHKNYYSKKEITPNDNSNAWAVQQYNNAIRSLANSKSTKENPPLDVILAVCLMMVCFEALQRQWGSVINHVQNGMKILTEHSEHFVNDPETMLQYRQLLAIFSNLETQVCRLIDPDPHLFNALSQSPILLSEALELRSPSIPFKSFDEAWLAMNLRWHYLMHSVWQLIKLGDFGDENTVNNFNVARQELYHSLTEWYSAFQELLERSKYDEGFERETRKVVALLESHYLTAWQLLDCLIEPGEMAWDQHRQNFQKIVDLAFIVAQEDNNMTGATSADSTANIPVLSVDHGIVPMLFHVIWKCRDAAIRKQAINILEQFPRLEGLWDGLLVAIVGKRIDELEREGENLDEAAARGAGVEEIPESERVLAVMVNFNSAKRHATLTYMKPGARSPSDPELWKSVVRIDEDLDWGDT